MNHPSENAFYEPTLRRVLWGDKREEVMHRLEINGVPAEEAEAIYREAVRERIATFRKDAWRKFLKGLLLSAISIAVVGGCGYLFSGREGSLVRFYIPKPLVALGGAAFLWGAWLMIDGAAGVLMAPSKEGPV